MKINSLFAIFLFINVHCLFGQNPYYHFTASLKMPAEIGFAEGTHVQNILVRSSDGVSTHKFKANKWLYASVADFGSQQAAESKHGLGIPLGFRFPYADDTFDIAAVSGQGFLVLGKSTAGGITLYADTMQYGEVDSIFTNRNSNLISCMMLGKEKDLVNECSISYTTVGFPSNKRICFNFSYGENTYGQFNQWGGMIELYENGDIVISPKVQKLFQPMAYVGTLIQRYHTTKQFSVSAAQGRNWYQPFSYFDSLTHLGGFPDTVTLTYQQNKAPFYEFKAKKQTLLHCPVPFVRSIFTGTLESSTAYEANDYALLEGDSVGTNVEVFWLNDSSTHVRYDASIGVNLANLITVQSNIGTQYLSPVFYAHPIGLSHLSLDSLVPNAPYVLQLLAHQDTATKSCLYHFKTGEEMLSKYCQSEVGQGSDNLYYKIAFHTLNYENTARLYAYNHEKSLFSPYNLVPATGTWTTTIQREKTYSFSLSPDPDMQFPNAPEVRVFFDFNHDGIFDVLTESFVTTKDKPRLASISIPATALLGKTRMRIANGITNGYPLEPCIGALDFVVNIAASDNCVGLKYTNTQQAPTCFGANTGTIQLLPTGGKVPYKVRWNTGDTTLRLVNKGFGYYRASISDSMGCTLRTPMFLLAQPEAIEIDTLSQEFLSISGGIGPYNAEIFSDKDTFTFVDLSSNGFYTKALPAGLYTIYVKDQQQCQQSIAYYKKVLGFTFVDNLLSFTVYPNPCSSNFQIKTTANESFQLVLYDVQGVKVASPTALGDNVFSIAHLPPGIYLLQYSNVHHVLYTKLMKM